MDNQELDPRLVEALDRVDAQLAAEDPHGDPAAKVEWLIKLFVMAGLLTQRHQKILKRVRANRSLPIVFDSPDPHKPDADIDCASRLHLCHARCCSFHVQLSEDEVRAGKVPWNLLEPYRLPKNPETNYCGHLGEEARCAVYEHRPGTCRKYDCRADPRVWVDFEQRIPAPMPFDVAPLHFDPP